MDVERHDRERLRMRDIGLRRLKLLTRTLTVGAAALVAVFAGLAAQASSRKAGRASSAPARTPANVKPTTRIPAAPSLPVLGSDGAAAAPAPQAPSQVPAQTSSPPVVSSGGS